MSGLLRKILVHAVWTYGYTMYVSKDCHHLPSFPHQWSGHKVREIYGQRTGHTVREIYAQRTGHKVREIYGQRTGHTVREIYGQRTGHKVREIYGQRINSKEFVRACWITSKAMSYATSLSSITSWVFVSVQLLIPTFCIPRRPIHRVPAWSWQGKKIT